MSPAPVLAALVPCAFISLVVSASAVCSSGNLQCEVGEDASLLATRRHQRHSQTLHMRAPAYPQVECPGLSGVLCSGDQCCPGVAATGGKTFPCPSAHRNFRRCDAGQDDLVEALLSALTRQEKYTFVRGGGWRNNSFETLPGYYVGNAGLRNRHGIPTLNMQDNGNGFRTIDRRNIDRVTSWPVALAVVSSWSEQDTERFAVALGKEFRAKGANVILGPGVNVARIARGGRNAEYLSGESAYLGARLVKPWVRGVQSQKVLAVVKHFAFNNQEHRRGLVNSVVDKRTAWEVYYPPFQAAIDADVAAVMCGYNVANGVPACGNIDLLLRDLKGTMGFKGWVQSDWWALHSFAALQGVDQEMPGDDNPYSKSLYTNARLDTLNMSKLDSMVRPQLAMMLKHGLFEPEDQTCQPDECNSSLWEVNATSNEHQALCKELATKAVLLLKNDNDVLPLGPEVRRIALVGSACNASQDVEALLGQWDLGDYYNLGGSGRVIAWNPVSILAGLSSKCQERGCEIVSELSDDVEAAMSKAQGADVVILCGATTATEGKDRESLSIDQESFLVEVAAGISWAPVVSLTVSPAAILMPWVENTDAVINLFFAGKYTGTAFAEVVFGDANPSAKSPITFPMTEDDTILPCERDKPDWVDFGFSSCNYSEGLFVGFAGLEEKIVRFPFGHGLSYTSFSYELVGISLADSNMPAGCAGAVACFESRISNKGGIAGVEVAQLYMGFPKGYGEPAKVLRGFQRTEQLQAGASADVVFPLFERDLQIYSGDKDTWMFPDGIFEVFIGTSSRDPRLTAAFALCKGEPTLDIYHHCMC